MHRTCMLAAAMMAASAGAAMAQDGDAAAGADLAAEWCARCHDISATGQMKQHPPSFAAIAVYRAPDQIEGRILFPGYHAGMPEWASMMDRDMVADLVAYIIGLE